MAATALAGLMLSILAACGGGSDDESSSDGAATTLEEVQKSGTIRMGVWEGLPSSAAKTTPTGILAEEAAMVFNELGVENVKAVPMDFGAMIPSIQSGRLDFGVGFYVTAERCDAATLSEPAFYYRDGMAVAKGNPHNIRTYEDVAKANVKIGVVSGTANLDMAQDAKVKESNISKYKDVPSLLDALKAGRIDVAPYDDVTIAYELTKPGYSSLSATEPTAPIVDGKEQPYAVSVAFAKDATDLADAFNEKQAEMASAGEFDDLLEEFGLDSAKLLPADAPGIEELCAQQQ